VEPPDMEHAVRNASYRVSWVDGTCQHMLMRFANKKEPIVVPTNEAHDLYAELKEAFDD
jgi:hypothetical protein